MIESTSRLPRRSRRRLGRRCAGVALLLLLASACRRTPELPSRTIEARLTADVAYAAWAPGPTRPGRREALAAGPVRRSAVAPPIRSARDSIAAVASALAVSVDVETLRRSVATLEAALPNGQPSRRLAALAAVELALGETSGEPSPLLDAYEHAVAAVAAGGGAVALFNQALIAGDLGLCRVAGEVWDRYLELDPSSEWAAEARRRAAELPCRIAADPGPDALWVEATEEDLPVWLEARTDDPERAAATLGRLEVAGEALAAGSGELGIRALATELGGLASDEHAAALSAYARGRSAFDAQRLDEADHELRNALPILQAAGSEMTPWCRLWLAGIDVYGGRFDPATAALDAILESLPAGRPYLVGRLQWAAGLAALRQGSFENAHDRLALAENAFVQGDYRGARGSVQTLRSDTLARLGLDAEGWRVRLEAIRDLQSPAPPYYLHNGLMVGATEALEQGKYDLSQAFLREAELLSDGTGDVVQAMETSVWQAHALCKVDPAAGTAAFQEVLARLPSAGLPPGVRAALEAGAVVGLAECAADPALLDENQLIAATLYLRIHGPVHLQLQGLRAHAALLVSHGDRSRARGILSAAIDLIHSTQARLDEGTAAARYREASQGTFDDAIALALDDGRPLDALALLEDARGLARGTSSRRTLERLLAGRSPAAASPTILDYGLIGDRIAWWRIEGPAVTSGVLPAKKALQNAQDMIDGLQQGRAPAPEIFEVLYEALLSGPLSGARSDRSLILIPDGVLQQIPFAALRNPDTGVRLIDERAISLRVSLEQAMSPATVSPTTVSPASKPRADWRVAVAGDPAFDETALPLLPRLPGARDEAAAVEGVYGAGKAVMLFGRSATPLAVGQAAKNAEVLHLAAHVLPGSEPANDVFVLAASDGGSGLVGPAALLLAGTPVRLAVLSACSSAGRRPSRTGGLLGLAHGFATRGVEATLGTLWPIADRSLEELMTDFHGGIRSGLAASEALRRAQSLQIRRTGGDDAGLDWAALALFGDLSAE